MTKRTPNVDVAKTVGDALQAALGGMGPPPYPNWRETNKARAALAKGRASKKQQELLRQFIEAQHADIMRAEKQADERYELLGSLHAKLSDAIARGDALCALAERQAVIIGKLVTESVVKITGTTSEKAGLREVSRPK